jgi:hypothetical protein
MAHASTSGAPAEGFETALSVLRRRAQQRRLSTGSQALDSLIGGLEPGTFYLFYGGCDEELVDRLLQRLVFEAVRPSGGEPGQAVYVVCGNYRRSRSIMDMDFLVSLAVEAGLDPEQVVPGIHVVCAFSERQLIKAPGLVDEVLGRTGPVDLVAVQQISKIFHGPLAVKRESPWEFTGVVSRLRETCQEQGIPLAATCRPAGKGRRAPPPEGGSYLSHAANVMVYLRPVKGGLLSAHLVKHPDSARRGRVVSFSGEEAWFWAE